MPRMFVQGPPSAHCNWILILFALLLTCVAQPSAQNTAFETSPVKLPAPGQRNGVIRLAIPELEGTYLYRFSVLKFNEAFARLGYGFELHAFPSERALVESNAGRMDGEAGRIQFDATLAAKYSNLVEVSEPTFFVSIGAYAADASIRLNGWTDLADKPFVIGYPRGIKVIERRLVGHVNARHLQGVNNIRQGLKMLQYRRIDVLIGLQTSVESVLDESAFADSKIVPAGIMEVVPVFPYLHKKHYALAPRLAVVLRAMKKDGTLDRLAEEAKLSIKPAADLK
ncbi:substrate-binding periplasmic protein [Desulfosarcina sp.]|uniref:substrate-binding periplasmic protein n=1 Tax=Desulfosarcina sp. TaxID=2027861 RepID=UPI003565934E